MKNKLLCVGVLLSPLSVGHTEEVTPKAEETKKRFFDDFEWEDLGAIVEQAEEIKNTLEDGLQWEDLDAIVEHAEEIVPTEITEEIKNTIEDGLQLEDLNTVIEHVEEIKNTLEDGLQWEDLNAIVEHAEEITSTEITTEYLHIKAEEIVKIFEDGLQWADFGTIVGQALDFITEHKDLSKEEVKANIITMLEHIIDITDTPHLPDSYSDPIFKSMLPPFVNLVVDGTHGLFADTLETKPGKPTPENLHDFIERMKETFADGFQWSDIMTTIKAAIEFAVAFPSLIKAEKQEMVINLVNHVIDDTDTSYLPDFFVDPTFKAIAPIFVNEIFQRLP